MISKSRLKMWLSLNKNVLFIGKHGVGKTTIVSDVFNEAELNWKYFSASTMDPWVDFIGIPKEEKNSDGSSYLKLVRPKEFETGEIEALFFDEYNRAPKKVRNAVMELIQFKSINGHHFPKLKVVWAAINPIDDEDTYNVEALDPAQEDRFHFHARIPYKPDLAYFSGKYGGPVAKAAVEWWDGHNEKQKDKVSPRRLDYALDLFINHKTIDYVFPKEISDKSFKEVIKNAISSEIIEKLILLPEEQILSWIKNENNYQIVKKILSSEQKYMDTIIPLLDKERISNLVQENIQIKTFCIKNNNKIEKITELVDSLNLAAIPIEKEYLLNDKSYSINPNFITELNLVAFQDKLINIDTTTQNDWRVTNIISNADYYYRNSEKHGGLFNNTQQRKTTFYQLSALITPKLDIIQIDIFLNNIGKCLISSQRSTIKKSFCAGIASTKYAGPGVPADIRTFYTTPANIHSMMFPSTSSQMDVFITFWKYRVVYKALGKSDEQIGKLFYNNIPFKTVKDINKISNEIFGYDFFV